MKTKYFKYILLIIITNYNLLSQNEKTIKDSAILCIENWKIVTEMRIDKNYLLKDCFVYRIYTNEKNFKQKLARIANECIRLDSFKPRYEDFRALVVMETDNKKYEIAIPRDFDYIKINKEYYKFNWELLINVLIQFPKYYIEECLKFYGIRNEIN